MSGKSRSKGSGVSEAKALLAKYSCPVPFHHVRARFMGNIATPDLTASPMKEVQRIWNNELPEFEDRAEAETFFHNLLQGLWNDLSSHQKRSDPFKLARLKAEPASFEYLEKYARVRREELDGFIEGLFAGQDEVDLPETAHNAFAKVSELRGLFTTIETMVRTLPAPAEVATMDETIKQMRELTRIANIEINLIIQSCKKARAQGVAANAVERPDRLH